MTAHPQEIAEAADVRSSELTDDAAAASFTKIFADDEGDGEPEADVEGEEEPETDTDEVEDDGDEQDDSDDEPEEPAIEAPVSLTADEKAQFAQLPAEAQRLIADVEARRNIQVQQATTRAADAQRAAESAAAAADADAKAVYAQQLMAFTARFAPQAPDPALARADPAQYIALDAQYRAEAAQHSQIVQQIEALRDEAERQFAQQEQVSVKAEWEAVIADVPEARDAAQMQQLLDRLTPLAVELGYPPELIANARPTDIRAVKRAAEWKAKADKWDAAQGRKMQRVRDAKTAKPDAAKPVKSSGERQLSEAQARLRQSGSDADAMRAFEAMGL